MNHRRYIAYTVARNGCSGGNLPPTGPKAGVVVHLYLYRLTQKRLSLYGVAPFNQTGYICNGASPWRGWMALGQRRYIAYTVAHNGCSGGNLLPTGPEGRNRGTFVSVSTNGASPWRGWMALGQRRYNVPYIG